MITCPVCWRTSYHPQDAEQRWCASCSFWTGDPQMLATRPDLQAEAEAMAGCVFCEDPIGDDERWHVVNELGQDLVTRRRRGHEECQLLHVVAHAYGFCDCPGFDHSRAAALEQARRMAAGQATFLDGP